MNVKLKAKIVEICETQSDFAQTIGVSEALVSRVIRERHVLTLKDQIKWAQALNVKPTEIFETGNSL